MDKTIRISIHALREEGDHRKPLRGVLCIQFLSTPSARRATTTRPETGNPEKISIHALREEGDLLRAKDTIADQIFLSTPSARRATAKTEKNISAFVSL